MDRSKHRLQRAMACGTPVVASGITALPEVVGDATVVVDPLRRRIHSLGYPRGGRG